MRRNRNSRQSAANTFGTTIQKKHGKLTAPLSSEANLSTSAFEV